MDGDLQPRKQKMELLRLEDELGIGSRSKSPCMTGFEDNSADAKEKEKPSVQMSTEWTNEKHILYLNSIEASFVTKMHSHDYHMMELRSWRLRKQKMLQPYLISSTGNAHFPSGQFKVLRRGCWEKINFRKARAQLNIGNESCLFSNSWIKHFMHSSNDQELADVQLSSSQGGSVLPSEGIHTQRRKCRTTNCGLAMSSDHPLSHHSDKHDQDFDDSNAEFSDQNFVDEDGLKGEQLINSCIEKMVNITGVDVSIKD
ncbi:hypothetical protein CKAN_00793700 [Cinnamomum micranthum f. kanehirae]|uniref:C2H2-type domain-containing protein n=1 Tax=Cinnamomum micranthum f. kanehirae TaxID=337451 RepID=A0A3S3M996_9MAGN|nr:hypothetical protein CKAN_00793700 [Cinnamomum micranthum f. kanehirae]